MASRHVVVDGSNIATEGRSLPSLQQLDEAVREFIAENPNDRVTVVVDATFSHRIDPSELPVFEEAETAGEVVSPPAGAVGRGDAFLLRVAEKTGATVLSNDSFQEFHAEHPWLFEPDRLIGGKPVPGVGWVFVQRAPVRGPKSREVVKNARKKKAAAVAAVPRQTGLEMAASRSKDKKVDRAIARATQEAVTPEPTGRRRRRSRSGEPPSEPVNEPLAFITFIAAHPLGSEVTGVVEEFTSHGAFVRVDGARCYVPLSGLGDPPPKRAREVLTKSDEVKFVIQALDPPRRGIELALPSFAHVAGGPTEETVEEEIHRTLGEGGEDGIRPAGRTGRRPAKQAAARAPEKAPAAPRVRQKAAEKAPAARAPSRKAAAKKADRLAEKRPAAKKASAKDTAAERSPAKAAQRKAPAEKSPAEKSPAVKTAGEKTAAKKAGAKRTVAQETPPKTPAPKTPAPKTPAPKTPATKTPATKTPATKKRAPQAEATKDSKSSGARRATAKEPAKASPERATTR